MPAVLNKNHHLLKECLPLQGVSKIRICSVFRYLRINDTKSFRRQQEQTPKWRVLVHVFFLSSIFFRGNFASGRNICRTKVWVIPGIHSLLRKKTSDDQEFGIAAGWNSMRNPKFMANQPTHPNVLPPQKYGHIKGLSGWLTGHEMRIQNILHPKSRRNMKKHEVNKKRLPLPSTQIVNFSRKDLCLFCKTVSFVYFIISLAVSCAIFQAGS